MIKDYLTRILGMEPKMRAYRDYVYLVVDVNTLQTRKHPISLKLADVNPPDPDSPAGRATKAYLASLLEGATVSVEPVSTDESGRPIAKVWYVGLNVNDMVNGYIDAQVSWSTN